MLALLGSLISVIPGLSNLGAKWITASYDAKVKITTAKIGGNVERAKELVSAAAAEDHERSIRLATISGSTLLTILLIVFALPFAIFIWKVVVWDIVLGSITNGITDPIRGQVADWATTIITAIFGSSTAVTIGKMVLSRKVDD